MEQITFDVKVNKEVVGQATCSKYNSVEEATSSIPADKLLKLINRSVKSEASNKVRLSFMGETPERAIARIARAAKKGEISKSDAAAQIQALAAKLAA
jgi:negative regulator of sigma E activity